MWHNDRKEMMNFKRGEYMVKMFFSPQWTQAAWKEKLKYSQQFRGLKPVRKRERIRNFSCEPPLLLNEIERHISQNNRSFYYFITFDCGPS